MNVNAQGLIDVELYGGPVLTYLKEGNAWNTMEIKSESFVNAHLGVNLLTRITDKWQVSLQGELFRSTSKLTESFSMSKQYSSKIFGNIALGARYNIKKGKKEFFFQPSIGALPYKELQFISNRQEVQRKVGITLRGEAGIKLYNKRDNYFLFGLRHQQGLNPIIHNETTDMRFSGNASYTGLVIGYGINSRKGLR